VESFDDIVKKGDEERARREKEQQRRLDSSRERLDKLVASFEQSLDTAFKVMTTSMPSLEIVLIEHSPPLYKGGVLQTSVRAKTHTESIDIEIVVQLGTQPGDGVNLGLVHVGELLGTVARRDGARGRGEPFAYRFSEEHIITPHCGVDPMTLQFNISQAIKRLIK